MGIQMPHNFLIAAIFFAAVGFAFLISGMVIDEWLTWDTDGKASLWSDCLNDPCAGWEHCVRFFGFFGFLGMTSSLVVGIIMVFMDNPLFYLYGTISGFGAAFCIAVEFSMYADKVADLVVGYAYSFYATVVAFPFALGAGVFFVLLRWYTFYPHGAQTRTPAPALAPAPTPAPTPVPTPAPLPGKSEGPLLPRDIPPSLSVEL